MSLLVQPRLVNAPDGDPGLYLDFHFGRRAMLFDLGDLAPLSPRELLRVSHAFVSHAHMDHVAGFDRLLRLRLHRPRPLTVTGPEGFVRQTELRLAAFTWNLLDATSVDFRLKALEFDGTRVSAAAEFRAREAFRRRDLPRPALPDGLVLEEETLAVEAAALDHGIPSLAFALQERLRVNVWRSALDDLGLPVGPWLDEAKRAIRAELPDDHPVAVPGPGEVRLGLLRERAFRVGRGQRVAYATDAADTPQNRERIVRLAREADYLFIETAFLDRDRTLAAATAHLTARAAGEIARAAGVRRVTGFHHSARYAEAPEELTAELAAAAGEGVAQPPPGPAPARPAARHAGDPDGPPPEAAWADRWRSDGLAPDRALDQFDALAAVEPDEMLGEWRGAELPTGHPLDGLLEALGWYGKRFETEAGVHPLLFGPGAVALDPARLPVGVALRWPRLARSAAARTAFAALRPALRTRRCTARLCRIEFRGTSSAAIVYDRQPIIDHFRRIDEARVLGVMQMRDVPPYFFFLARSRLPARRRVHPG